MGTSLVRFDRADAARRLAAVSEVADARFDRAFPHTLKVRVQLERPVAVLRRGSDAWLVSAHAACSSELRAPVPAAAADLAAAHRTDIAVNSTLGGARSAAACARSWRRSGRSTWSADVRQVLAGDGELTLVLASGTELRLGDSGDLRLKLVDREAIAAARRPARSTWT